MTDKNELLDGFLLFFRFIYPSINALPGNTKDSFFQRGIQGSPFFIEILPLPNLPPPLDKKFSEIGGPRPLGLPSPGKRIPDSLVLPTGIKIAARKNYTCHQAPERIKIATRKNYEPY